MDTQTLVIMALLMGLGAMLYTSVGHAGASAYLAIMAIFGVEPAVMRPTALVLNILVASYTTLRFARAGQVDWRLALPFMAGAVPLAFIAGGVALPAANYRPLVGAILLLAAVRLLWPRPLGWQKTVGRPPLLGALASGAAVGGLSGLTGTGGGIFLSPILLFFGWAEPRRASGVAAAFILVNSLAGLAGNLSGIGRLPPELPWLILAVGAGATIGSTLGLSHLTGPRLMQVLGVVLLIAGGKLLLT